MPKPITPEMIAAWRTLQEYALSVRRFVNISAGEEKVAKAIDVLDNSDFMVPIEEAGADEENDAPRVLVAIEKHGPLFQARGADDRVWSTATTYKRVQEHLAELSTAFVIVSPEQLPQHAPICTCGGSLDGRQGGIGCTEQPPNDDPGAPHGRGKCTHCGHPRVPLTPGGLTMYHGDVNTGQGDCLGSLQPPEQPLDPTAWGDTTRADMARHQKDG